MNALQDSPFGMLLKQYRRAAGFTQEALARQAGYSSIYIRKLECGERSPTAHTISALADALGLTSPQRASLAAAARRSTTCLPHPLQWSSFALSVGPPPPLIGRASELAICKEHLARDAPPLLALAGEPGIGKTRLLQEAARQGHEQGYAVLIGSCHRRSGQEPYTPFLDMLSRVLAQYSVREQTSLLEGCAWLARLLPELVERAVISPPPWTVPSVQERRLMFASIARFLTNIAGPGGTLLVLDDLQWAGADALDLLNSLIRSTGESRLRVIGAYRDTEVHQRDALSVLLVDLAQTGLAKRLSLGPLTYEEASALFNELLEEIEIDRKAAALERIFPRVGGVPYFLVSYAQELRSGIPVKEENIPQSVAESIRQRVVLLPEAAQRLLEAAAVTGREVDRALLLGLIAPLQWTKEQVLSALEATCQARLLVETEKATYRFVHDLIREVISANLSGARRALLHQQVAELLEEQSSELPLELLAHHYCQAGNLEKAVVYLERAGDRAHAMYAYTEAEHYYRDLLEHLTQLGRDTARRQAQEKLAEVLGVQAQYSEALSILEEMLTAYQAAQNLEGVARVLTKIGKLQAARGSSAAGLTFLTPWLDLLTSNAISAQSKGWLTLALTYLFMNSGRHHEGLLAAKQAVALAHQAQDSRLLCQAQWHLGRNLMLLNRLEEAITQLKAALPLAEQIGDRRMLCYVFSNLNLAYTAQGQLREAKRYSEDALVMAEQLGDLVLLAHVLTADGWNAFLLGDWEQSRAKHERAIALMRQTAMPWGAAFPLQNLGYQLLAQGETEAGMALIEEACALAKASQTLEVLYCAQSSLAEYELLNGRPQQARDRLKSLVERANAPERSAIEALPFLGWAYLELGQHLQAKRLAEQMIGKATAQQAHPALTDALRLQAMLAAHRGHWQEAGRTLAEALRLAQAMLCPYAEAKACYTGGLIFLARKDTTQASTQLRKALGLLNRLGERLYAQRIEQVLIELEHPETAPQEAADQKQG